MGKTITSASLPQSWPDSYITKSFFGHEVITFGYSEGVDIKCRPEDTFEEILSRLPEGWTPDICICTHIDWVFIPPGIENAPFPIINITADWDYRLPIAKTCADIFDMTIVLGDDSKKAVESLGAPNVYPFHYFGVMREHIVPNIDTGTERDIDISFTGNINDISHVDRSKWLLRLCNLSKRYNIYINYYVVNIDDYQNILRNSKLVFTFHRRGEVQLRFTDATAQGALVLDSGKETAKYFNSDEYAKFDDNNFEEVIEKYLSDESLRKTTVKKCHEHVSREFESRDRFKKLIDFIESKFNEISNVKRNFANLPEETKLLRRAETFYYNYYDGFIPRHISYLFTSAKLIEEALNYKKTPQLLTNLAVVKSSIGLNTSEFFKEDPYINEAISILEDTIREYPDYAMAYFNLAFLYFSIGDNKSAELNFRSAIDVMRKNPKNIDPWCLYHFEHNNSLQTFNKILNDLLIAISSGNNSRGIYGVNNLYISTCWYFLGKIFLNEGKCYEALECWKTSISKNCERGNILKEAANLAELLGDGELALKMYNKAIGLLPLDIDFRYNFIKFLYRSELYEQCLDVSKETLKVCTTVKKYRNHINSIKKILLFLERKIGEKSFPFESLDAFNFGFILNTIEFLTIAQSKNPKDKRLLFRHASLLIDAERCDEAIRIIEKMKDKTTNDDQKDINDALKELYLFEFTKCKKDLKHFKEKISALAENGNNATQKVSAPAISVLVRTFNRRHLLGECLESLTKQEFKNFEVVLVNDGGEDVSDIVSQFSDKLSITQVIHGKNLGRSAAWNSAVNAARGKYLSFLDDDDIYYPSHLKDLREAIRRENVKVAYSNCYSVREVPGNNGISNQLKEKYKTEDFTPDLFLMKNYIPIITLMAEKESVEDAGLFDENFEVHEDWDMLVRLAMENDFYHLHKETSEYRVRADKSNSCTGEREKYLDTLIMLYKKYEHLAKDNPEIVKIQNNNIELLKMELERGSEIQRDDSEKYLSA